MRKNQSTLRVLEGMRGGVTQYKEEGGVRRNRNCVWKARDAKRTFRCVRTHSP